MKIQVIDQRLRPTAFFKATAVGYTLGLLVVFVPLSVLGILAGTLGTPAFDGKLSPVLFLVLLPLIAALQGIIVACFVTMGLWIYTKARPIKVLG